jgi:CubicO group peptidase (beta-lactamase class C family)
MDIGNHIFIDYLRKQIMKISSPPGFKLLSFVMVFFWLSISGCPLPPADITPSSGDRDLAQLLERMRIKAKQTALAAAVVIDGKIKAAAAVGTRKYGTKNWVTVDDRFIIASCGKAFTATLAAIMVEEGRLNWGTTIKDVFPELKMRAEYENMNLQQLLSHRAGLIKSFVADLDSNRTYTSTAGRLVYLEQLVQTKPIHPPGTVMFYSNAGYILAGVMMEKISDQEFTDLMSKKVFKPLNLTTAGYGPPAKYSPTSQPWGHFWDKSSRSLKPVRTDDPHWIDPAGNVSLSIKDWARFIIGHMPSDQKDSTAFLNSRILKKLHTPVDSVNWKYDENYLKFWNNEIGWPLTSANYALGWFVTKAKDGETVLNHAGTSQAFQAEVYLSPDNKNAILLATNARMGHIHLYRTAIKIKEKYALKIDLP